MAFRAPIADIAYTLREIAGLDRTILGDVAPDTADAILAAAGRFAETELAPLNRIGDREGASFAGGVVRTAPGWREAYRRFAAAGWTGVGADPRWGGQGLPAMMEMAVEEMWNGAAAAFATGTMLTAGGILALEAHGSEAVKRMFLPGLVSGRFAATMNLTEPQAGSDLGALAARAERYADGNCRISGQKVLISYGEHDLTENIVHLVLARLSDAPPGTAGISMFVVPKFLVGADGAPGARNGVMATGIEHKLGLHAAPTCTMVYDEAVGYLVGEEHRGLACMFTMMNITRLSVGIQAVGVAERAFQEALAYAHLRRQGRAPGWQGEGMSPIVEHPDVQQMLMRMQALIAASRAICYACAHSIDMSRRADAAERAAWASRAALLTPIAKAFSADAGIEVASLGIQVHGGAGYIEETGAAQHLRDVRVFAIYEGTNGIQAADLVSRKLLLDEGAAICRLVDAISGLVSAVEADESSDLGDTGAELGAAIACLRATTDEMIARLRTGEKRTALAVASAYLRLFGLTLGGALLARGALAARTGTPLNEKAVAIARFFAETMLGETKSLRKTVTSGAGAVATGARAVLFPQHGDLT